MTSFYASIMRIDSELPVKTHALGNSIKLFSIHFLNFGWKHNLDQIKVIEKVTLVLGLPPGW